jgi:hypothetical protein
MRGYREALAELSPEAKLPEDIAGNAIEVLEDENTLDVVSSTVPERVRKSYAQAFDNDPKASRKRTYDVSALMASIGLVLWQLVESLPKLSQAGKAATGLWDEYWPILKRLLIYVGWS